MGRPEPDEPPVGVESPSSPDHASHPVPPPRRTHEPEPSGTVAAPPRSRSSRMLWAQLLERILLHLDLPHRPPRVSPARGPPQAEFDLDQSPAFDLAAPEPIPELPSLCSGEPAGYRLCHSSRGSARTGSSSISPLPMTGSSERHDPAPSARPRPVAPAVSHRPSHHPSGPDSYGASSTSASAALGRLPGSRPPPPSPTLRGTFHGQTPRQTLSALGRGPLKFLFIMPINRPRSYEGRARLLEASPTGRPGEVIQDLPAPEHYVDRDELNALVVPVPHGELEHRQDQIPAELDHYFTDKFRRALSRLELPDSSTFLTFILGGREGQVWLQTGERTDHGPVWRLWKPGESDATPFCAISITHAGEVVAGSAAGGRSFSSRCSRRSCPGSFGMTWKAALPSEHHLSGRRPLRGHPPDHPRTPPMDRLRAFVAFVILVALGGTGLWEAVSEGPSPAGSPCSWNT